MNSYGKKGAYGLGPRADEKELCDVVGAKDAEPVIMARPELADEGEDVMVDSNCTPGTAMIKDQNGNPIVGLSGPPGLGGSKSKAKKNR